MNQTDTDTVEGLAKKQKIVSFETTDRVKNHTSSQEHHIEQWRMMDSCRNYEEIVWSQSQAVLVNQRTINTRGLSNGSPTYHLASHKFASKESRTLSHVFSRDWLLERKCTNTTVCLKKVQHPFSLKPAGTLPSVNCAYSDDKWFVKI